MHQTHSARNVVGPHWAVVFPQVVPEVPSPTGGPGKAKRFLTSVYVQPNLEGKSAANNNTTEMSLDYFQSQREGTFALSEVSPGRAHTQNGTRLLVHKKRTLVSQPEWRASPVNSDCSQ